MSRPLGYFTDSLPVEHVLLVTVPSLSRFWRRSWGSANESDEIGVDVRVVRRVQAEIFPPGHCRAPCYGRESWYSDQAEVWFAKYGPLSAIHLETSGARFDAVESAVVDF